MPLFTLLLTSQPHISVLDVHQTFTPTEASSTSAPGLSGPLPPGGPLGTTPANRLVLPPLHELRKKESEEILNLILPPREWEEAGKQRGETAEQD